MDISRQTIGDLVAEDYKRATVFKRHGIDFCCGGGRTLEAVCEKRGLDIQELTRELDEAENRSTDNSIRASSWSPDFLADYIVNEHHTYVRESIPILSEFTAKVAKVHGRANPEVVEIAGLFAELADEMSSHMMKEERVLFPYIKELVASSTRGDTPAAAPFGSVRNPIRLMEHEHEAAGAIMKEIRRLSSDFNPPEHACNTYRVAFAKLEEFEGDLHRHVHLENYVLFPKAARLEEDLQTSAPR